MSPANPSPAPDLLTRLREAAQDSLDTSRGPVHYEHFTPERVQRGLERMRKANTCGVDGIDGLDAKCSRCWAAMLDAFIAGATQV